MASTLPGTAYVPFISGSLPDILCEHNERTVANDTCVAFEFAADIGAVRIGGE